MLMITGQHLLATNDSNHDTVRTPRGMYHQEDC
jgi:hypothetical protein